MPSTKTRVEFRLSDAFAKMLRAMAKEAGVKENDLAKRLVEDVLTDDEAAHKKAA